eukprot:14720874-Heterocapsa_arctica.AAC.1
MPTYVKTTFSAPQDNSEGYAISGEMSKVQLTLNRMKKRHILVNKGLAHSTEGAQPYDQLENAGTEAIE